MPAPKVASVDFAPPADVSSGDCELPVAFEGGGGSTFKVATFDRAEAWMASAKSKAWWSEPVLFVASLDRKTVRAAVDAMAIEMGGYWLRYYDHRRTPVTPASSAVGHIELVHRSDPTRPAHSSGVIEVYLKDGRQFTVLAATPSWFKGELRRLGLPFYYGPAVLFLKKMDPASARKAAKEMLAEDEQLLVRYDTPRRTLLEVLSAFRAAHP